jgi:hypothetical protein
MKGQIYKLTSPNTDMIYIGSTGVPLNRRYNKHKNDADCSSKILFEFGDVSIHLIREVEFETQLDLRKQEQIEMDKYDGKLCNKKRAYITPVVKKELKKKYQKEYHTSNKVKEYRIIYKAYKKSHFGVLCKAYGIFNN